MENFLGVQGEQVIPLSRLPNGVWFIEGSNGAGKSTLLEAMTWCQFGQFLRSDMLADYAINDRIGTQCRVRLDFNNGVSIERFRKYSSLGGTGVRVYKHGVLVEEMEKGESRHSQEAIQHMLGIDFETFARTVL
jgi:DNA repair exonuclease SbcCD ATPase subunit